RREAHAGRELARCEIAPRKMRTSRPGWPALDNTAEPSERLLRQSPIGRDLPTIDREEGCRAAAFVELEHVVPAHVLRAPGAVIVERADSREGPNHVARLDGSPEMLVCNIAEIRDFSLMRVNRAEITGKTPIRRSDQREFPFKRQREHDPPVTVLEDVAAVVLEQAPHDDMAAFIEPQRNGCA